jgi:putative restriction endonuclease
MPISFVKIGVGQSYSRNDLALLWGFKSFHAIARGVVTPKGDNKIVLFVTEEKQASAEQYADRLVNDVLDWEGPNDHFAEERMLCSAKSSEEIHLFHRAIHHTDFTYVGQVVVIESEKRSDRPSRFKFKSKTV